MERILQSSEMAEIVLIPVRHHSPACSLHLRNMIRREKPDIILIEGPENANELIDIIADETTKPPFAIYYSYNDKKGIISDKKNQYKCYYPFTDYSPEYVAITEAYRLCAKVNFIDLTYADIINNQHDGMGLLKDDDKNNYNDDYLLSNNEYIVRLCEKAGTRNFDEFWEKYYEINGLIRSDEEWFEKLYEYCKIAREHTLYETLIKDGDIAREICMAYNILNEAVNNPSSKIMVVTGGMHTVALYDRITRGYTAAKKEYDDIMRHRISNDNQAVYIIAYTEEALASLNGYASGMPYPGYYEDIWRQISLNENDTDTENADKTEELQLIDECDNAECSSYYNSALSYIVNIARKIRKEDGGLSTSDEISAYTMATGLARLRGKAAPGSYEIYDAILSCYVKGEVTTWGMKPLEILKSELTGKRIGKLGDRAGIAPIVENFNELCKKYKIDITSTIEKEKVLSFYAKDSHREISRFFHRLSYLKVPFAVMTKGPNLQKRTDKNLVRETWRYKWSGSVHAALTDVSVYGQTIEEAAGLMAENELKKNLNAKETAILYTHIFEMGLMRYAGLMSDRLKESVIKDNDFYSLSEALSYFEVLIQMSSLYSFVGDIDEVTRVTVRKILMVLKDYTRIKDEELELLMNTVKLIYHLTREYDSDNIPIADIGTFIDVLKEMIKDTDINPGLNGCIYGVLYATGSVDTDVVKSAAFGYLSGTREQNKKVAAFFRGLFFSARDIVFADREFIDIIDSFFEKTQAEDFMQLLPEIRMAFAFFTPLEIERIAKTAAMMHGKGKEEILYEDAVDTQVYEYGKMIDEYVMSESKVIDSDR